MSAVVPAAPVACFMHAVPLLRQCAVRPKVIAPPDLAEPGAVRMPCHPVRDPCHAVIGQRELFLHHQVIARHGDARFGIAGIPHREVNIGAAGVVLSKERSNKEQRCEHSDGHLRLNHERMIRKNPQ